MIGSTARMGGWLLTGLLMAGGPATARDAAPERGSAEVTGRSAFETAIRSGEDRGRKFCLRIMYNNVPLPLYGEIYIEGNATTCDGTERLAVDRIAIQYRYRGEPLQRKECSGTHQCDVAERFYRGTKELDCAAVIAASGNWSATAATAPGCLGGASSPE